MEQSILKEEEELEKMRAHSKKNNTATTSTTMIPSFLEPDLLTSNDLRGGLGDMSDIDMGEFEYSISEEEANLVGANLVTLMRKNDYSFKHLMKYIEACAAENKPLYYENTYSPYEHGKDTGYIQCHAIFENVMVSSDLIDSSFLFFS